MLNVDIMLLRDNLEKIRKELAKKDMLKQEIKMAARKATRLSKQAIFQIHKENLKNAGETLEEARETLEKIREITKNHPDLFYTGPVNSAFQEYAEANIFLSLIKDSRFPEFEELNIPMDVYILGLADVIGELRRRALESLRKDMVSEAERCLRLMETIYEEIINLEDIQILVSSLRKKCDAGRRIIEATRADVMIEFGRISLERQIMNLINALDEVRNDESAESS
ncbi:haloacid dehalogenase [Candidatus Bathyarchaeota archaeon]|nr:MAG: haloacid dehalogenase [Candidatus Bathyarchaeota archaeon]